ncbi:MAG: DUF1887 family protein [Rhodocyclaceae bacterium]|nr:DUF1887 family protein [Rhodocyclaceae bacterium]
MALSRCGKCFQLAEHEREAVGMQVACAHCGTLNTVYDTVFFVSKLLEQYFVQRRELSAFRENSPSAEPAASALSNRVDFDIHDTDRFSNDAQHQSIVEFFRKRSILVSINPGAVDTSGFFDEAAMVLGSDYALCKEMLDRIRFAQHKEFNSALIQLDRKTNEEIKALEAIGRKLYEYSLVARFFHNKPEKNMRLVLQNAPSVRHFFSGAWLEWFALMTGLRVLQDRGTVFSCARNLELSFPPNEKRELDVFFLLEDERPIYIECKSGEFRQELDKYVALRKRLALEARSFIVCVADLDVDQAKALGAMYDMTFSNTESLGPHLASLL